MIGNRFHYVPDRVTEELRKRKSEEPFRYLTQDLDGWFKIHQLKPQIGGKDRDIWVSLESNILIINHEGIMLPDPLNTIIDLEDYK